MGYIAADNQITYGINEAAVFKMNYIAANGAGCPGYNGAIAQDGTGQLLNCVLGVWKRPGGNVINFAAAHSVYVGDGGRCPANEVAVGVGGFYATYTAGYIWCVPVS